MTNAKTVYVAYTGGTIGMQKTATGYAPAPGFLSGHMQTMPELQHPSMPAHVVHEYEQLLDSANMTPGDWVRVAEDIERNYDAHDAFLILHGTDTMAYTASALSFMLENLNKTVIVTGSQVPLTEVRNDARDNLISSLLIAGQYHIPEVCLFFHNTLYRGNRTTKVDADHFDAFASPNFPALGEVGVDVDIVERRVLVATSGADLNVHRFTSNPYVGMVRLFPGISVEIMRNFLQPPLQGLVLETYGVGNAPNDNPAFLDALHEADQRGVVIVNCTQCLRGTVNIEEYATGASLKAAGVISGYDMTPEAALTKLYYLFSQQLPQVEVKRQMQADLRGELTPPDA